MDIQRKDLVCTTSPSLTNHLHAVCSTDLAVVMAEGTMPKKDTCCKWNDRCMEVGKLNKKKRDRLRYKESCLAKKAQAAKEALEAKMAQEAKEDPEGKEPHRSGRCPLFLQQPQLLSMA
jgi:hypothetical protein